jgi:hypothetical protein
MKCGGCKPVAIESAGQEGFRRNWKPWEASSRLRPWLLWPSIAAESSGRGIPRPSAFSAGPPKNYPQFASLPVVALTAFAMLGAREKPLSARFDACLSKPVDPRSLRAEIQRVLTQRESEPAV